MEKESSPPCPNTVAIRRNPHRKARATPSSACPQVPTTSSSSAVVSSFPIQEILSMDVPILDPKHHKPKPFDCASENLRVFLRIRPLVPSKFFGKSGGFGEQIARSRGKNVWPQKPVKKNSARESSANTKRKTNEVCISVNDSHSVTLSPPLLLQGVKRIKSEVYGGFSYVFASDSSQEEVYQKMVNPLVEDFLKGKSGMLAAMGPSGSGKTHTVFGSPREPGMLTLALQQIFKSVERIASDSLRSFCISIFEIRSESGKGEKLYDLSPNGAELIMQQSTIKGLQEVNVSNAGQAESFLTQAMLKRVTATTNSNSQSSRSQCIINIRRVADNAILDIIDLAGAERERRTGNQGVRLLESNFINNTSMVFGLCLRSLLEHQKNPKRPLQKHFQNSLLTRYLRDYLEGKKRMALILTVKSGEEDYFDTTYVLRQASPFMKIKFDNLEEPCNKRHSQSLCRAEKPKKMKFSGPDDSAIEKGNTTEDGDCFSGQGCLKALKSNGGEQAQEERKHQILQNFNKALWNVLKQHRDKLKEAENEIQSLRENLKVEKARWRELEKELGDFKSRCTCSQESSVEVTSVGTDRNFDPQDDLNGLESSAVDTVQSNMDLYSSNFEASECKCTSEKFDSTPKQDQKTNVELRSSTVRASECNNFSKESSRQDQDVISPSQEEFAPIGHTAADALDGEPRTEKPEELKDQTPRIDSLPKPKEPKRRLMPASNALLNFAFLDINDDIEKPKGIRGGKKVGADERKRTPGTITLLRLIHGN
ncbi:hypothetical protein FNV43_RR11977 [Rhamnella rubrinervis]|uniref:Kinesin motor domain-containing protein n=1 Tax=Rhamnella rubrinervis TaxID=2594499 RepID=A0A8K0MI82_9ROSA|nr:hypothetical protein FNV43_RR11977 [Rhamnella rubrinervis]